MAKMFSLVIGVLAMGLISTAASASSSKGVDSCAKDSYTRKRIEKEIPAQSRLAVTNAKNEVVGAFDFDPASGDISALYLCGNNSGYYYAKGNIHTPSVDSVYNDEYDSTLDFVQKDDVLEIQMLIVFSGEAEDADYGPVEATVYVKVP